MFDPVKNEENGCKEKITNLIDSFGKKQYWPRQSGAGDRKSEPTYTRSNRGEPSKIKATRKTPI